MMIKNVKEQLLENPTSLKNILEEFGYCHIAIRPQYIQFGRDKNGGKKSIILYLSNNKYLYVKDHAKNINKELFSYIMEQKGVSFLDILSVIKKELGIENFHFSGTKKDVFGGFYTKIRKKQSINFPIYNENQLSEFARCGNLRFLKDNISIETQTYFNIHYDIQSQSIVIPIYDSFSQLMGLKARVNKDVKDGEQKYFYLIPCLMSQTLYGYSHNYNYLVDNTILVFESEKSVMQCHTYGIKNCVALGSSSISKKQTQLLLELNPKQVIFMHDEGLDFSAISKNIETVKEYSKFQEFEIGYWDFSEDLFLLPKVSSSDMGKERLLNILESQIKFV